MSYAKAPPGLCDDWSVHWDLAIGSVELSSGCPKSLVTKTWTAKLALLLLQAREKERSDRQACQNLGLKRSLHSSVGWQAKRGSIL